MRKPALVIAVLLIAAAVILALSLNKPAQTQTQGTNTGMNSTDNPASASPNATTPRTPASNISIATFNIQVFGQAKSAKPDVISVLSKIARNFDVMAIQELRDENETTLPYYISQINSLPGPAYAAISSP